MLNWNLIAWVTENSQRKAVIEATLSAAGEVTATGTGVFVAGEAWDIQPFTVGK